MIEGFPAMSITLIDDKYIDNHLWTSEVQTIEYGDTLECLHTKDHMSK